MGSTHTYAILMMPSPLAQPSAEKLRMQLKVEAFGTEEESWLSKQAVRASPSRFDSALC